MYPSTTCACPWRFTITTAGACAIAEGSDDRAVARELGDAVGEDRDALAAALGGDGRGDGAIVRRAGLTEEEDDHPLAVERAGHTGRHALDLRLRRGGLGLGLGGRLRLGLRLGGCLRFLGGRLRLGLGGRLRGRVGLRRLLGRRLGLLYRGCGRGRACLARGARGEERRGGQDRRYQSEQHRAGNGHGGYIGSAPGNHESRAVSCRARASHRSARRGRSRSQATGRPVAPAPPGRRRIVPRSARPTPGPAWARPRRPCRPPRPAGPSGRARRSSIPSPASPTAVQFTSRSAGPGVCTARAPSSAASASARGAVRFHTDTSAAPASASAHTAARAAPPAPSTSARTALHRLADRVDQPAGVGVVARRCRRRSSACSRPRWPRPPGTAHPPRRARPACAARSR